MRYTLFSFFLLLTVSLSAQNWWNSNRVKGNGDVTTEQRDGSGFTEIHTCCSFKVELTQDDDFDIRVEAESNLLEYIETEVRGNTLRIKMADNVSVNSTEPMRIYVSLPLLEQIQASSSSSVKGTNAFSGKDLEIDVSSSASVRLDFSGDDVNVDVSSSGSVNLEGSASEVKASASSSGSIDAREMKSETANAQASSAGSVTVYASQKVRARASSAGSVSYYGNPDNVDSDTSSAGRVRSRN